MYKAHLKVHFDTEWTSTHYSSGFDDTVLPEEHYTFQVPAEDLNVYQLFRFFATVARAMGHDEIDIMKGGCALAFNDSNTESDMKKLMEEYELQDKQLYTDDEARAFEDEVRTLKTEVFDLKAKLARCENPNAEQYLDEEIEAMNAQNEVTVKTLRDAEVVCKDCGSKYGHYSVGCSSSWMGKCDVCVQEKSITEVRDWNYLKEGIRDLKK